MKKKTTRKKTAKKEKSIFRIAGEAIGTLGHEIVEGKDKLVEVSQAAVEKINLVKDSLVKKAPAKKVKPAIKKKLATAKKTAKKAVKKVAKKIVKKTAKKRVAKS